MPSRRGFLKGLGLGTAAVAAVTVLPPTIETVQAKVEDTATKIIDGEFTEITEPPKAELFRESPENLAEYGRQQTLALQRSATVGSGASGLHGSRTIIIANGCAVENVGGHFRVIARHDGRLMGPRQIAAMYEGL